MINSQMRKYETYKYGEQDAYGLQTLSTISGSIKMAINQLSKTIAENSLYSSAQYLGLTQDTTIDDTYVVQYGSEKLKVLYTNTMGRYTQVWMVKI